MDSCQCPAAERSRLFQVLVDSDSVVIIRVKGPLEFRCLLDSTDGTFTDTFTLQIQNKKPVRDRWGPVCPHLCMVVFAITNVLD